MASVGTVNNDTVTPLSDPAIESNLDSSPLDAEVQNSQSPTDSAQTLAQNSVDSVPLDYATDSIYDGQPPPVDSSESYDTTVNSTEPSSQLSVADTPDVNNNVFFAESQNSASENGLPSGLSQEQYDRAVDFGKLSAQAYDWDDFAVAETGMKVFGGIDDIRNVDFSTDNYDEIDKKGNYIDWWWEDSLDYKVFENKNKNEIVVAYKGTEPLSAADWTEDALQTVGMSKQYTQAIDFAKSLKANIDNYNQENNLTGDNAKKLYFTGHSLGGGLATASALATGSQAIVFDAAGLSSQTIDKYGLDVNNANNVTNFNVQGDFVSDYNDKMDSSTAPGTGTQQYGSTYWLKGVNDQADFMGPLVPDKYNPVAWAAEKVLNHAWHVYTYQLENKKFV